MYIYLYINIYIHIYIHTYIKRERGERRIEGEDEVAVDDLNGHLRPSRPRLVPARPKVYTGHVRQPLRFPKRAGRDGSRARTRSR